MRKMDNVEIKTLKCKDDGSIPNHPELELLIYKHVVDSEDDIKSILSENDWLGIWENGIAPFHHYHSNSHEVLIVTGGSAEVQFGGEHGEKIQLEKGDAVILPAGFGHKKLNADDDFTVIGAYPEGKEYDFCYGKPAERPENIKNIKNVPLPANDPLYGREGPLFLYWKYNR